MTRDQVKAVLERVPTWPEDRQQGLAKVALEIEAELAGAVYHATPDDWQRLTKASPGRPPARKKSRRHSLCSRRHKGRIFKYLCMGGINR
jgi:hypothetical protein